VYNTHANTHKHACIHNRSAWLSWLRWASRFCIQRDHRQRSTHRHKPSWPTPNTPPVSPRGRWGKGVDVLCLRVSMCLHESMCLPCVCTCTSLCIGVRAFHCFSLNCKHTSACNHVLSSCMQVRKISGKSLFHESAARWVVW
jgi:hypothetical protein